MAHIEFSLNGNFERIEIAHPTHTLLDWLRETKKLTGTKEGCNEGDCGACTVMVSEHASGQVTHKAMNSCILFLPQLDGKSVRTVEGIQGPRGEPHPVQNAMVEHNGSQCGFCTPGFVMSMVTAHLNGQTHHDDILAGNLCRCTGYEPIVRAARSVEDMPSPNWFRPENEQMKIRRSTIRSERLFVPRIADELAAWYLDHPGATLVAGATDVGLWVTKQLREPETVAFVSQIEDLAKIEVSDGTIEIGTAVSLAQLQAFFEDRHTSFGELIRRFGSVQVRNAATIGGNIANGSPIGDVAPALIALGARLRLRRGEARRTIKLEDFFVSYGKQDRMPGEFIEAVLVPDQGDRLKCFKISKRFDQDISAVCGCFNIIVENGLVASARIAFGGMAETPKRASRTEKALLGREWAHLTVEEAKHAMSSDFTPISDMRASAGYRMNVARNLLLKCFLESGGEDTPLHVLGCAP